MSNTATYILTLRMDAASEAWFDRMRERYYPPERNQIRAHLTLFHTLPEDEGMWAAMRALAARYEAFRMEVTGVRLLGKGVAYRLSSGRLLELHAGLAALAGEHLTAQDRQRFQPHVVVQNKVTPAAARELLTELERDFVSFGVAAVGLDLWEYLGGPWRHRETMLFGAVSGLG